MIYEKVRGVMCLMCGMCDRAMWATPLARVRLVVNLRWRGQVLTGKK